MWRNGDIFLCCFKNVHPFFYWLSAFHLLNTSHRSTTATSAVRIPVSTGSEELASDSSVSTKAWVHWHDDRTLAPRRTPWSATVSYCILCVCVCLRERKRGKEIEWDCEGWLRLDKVAIQTPQWVHKHRGHLWTSATVLQEAMLQSTLISFSMSTHTHTHTRSTHNLSESKTIYSPSRTSTKQAQGTSGYWILTMKLQRLYSNGGDEVISWDGNHKLIPLTWQAIALGSHQTQQTSPPPPPTKVSVTLRRRNTLFYY